MTPSLLRQPIAGDSCTTTLCLREVPPCSKCVLGFTACFFQGFRSRQSRVSGRGFFYLVPLTAFHWCGSWVLVQAFGKRLERDIKKRVTARYNRNLELYNITREEDKPKKLDVEVESTSTQKYAAWFGGSVLGAEPGFKAACHSRADYMEHGARIVRNTQGFA